jgi:hypothetical protein
MPTSISNPPAAIPPDASRSLLRPADRAVPAGKSSAEAEEERVRIGHALLAAVNYRLRPVRITAAMRPQMVFIDLTIPSGGTLRAEVSGEPHTVELALTDVPLPRAERFLAPLLPRPAAVPRPRDRKPTEWRVSGRAARRLATLYDLTSVWTATRDGRGDDHRVYTVQLEHNDSSAHTVVTVPPGAPGRPTTLVDIVWTGSADTALLALAALR